MNKPRANIPASTNPPQQRSASLTRWIALLIAAPFLLLIVAFMVMPFISQDEVPLQAVGPVAPTDGAAQGGIVFRGTANIWEVRGQMMEDNGRRVRFDIKLIGPTGQPPSSDLRFALALEQSNGNGDQISVPVQRTGMGSYASGATALPEAGRWRLRMIFPEVQALLEFETRR